MTRFAATFALLLLLCSGKALAEGGRTILVLDASGSMWGQIEGKAKITIAQQVIGSLLEAMPEDEALGLYAYGHREKGNCSDIEALVLPGQGKLDDVRRAVNAIKPRGKTPLSASVIAAAEALRYEEDRATVILVSDGRENCERDPCAVAQALEEAGADFTAHVIGFDVADPEEIRQLSCIAESTGGAFVSASDELGLSEALERVTIAAPTLFDTRLVAEGGSGGDVTWEVSDADGAVLRRWRTGAEALIGLEAGQYGLKATDEATAAEGRVRFEVREDGGAGIVRVALAGPSLSAPATAAPGERVAVSWTGPGGAGDRIHIMTAGEPDDRAITSADIGAPGSPVFVEMPMAPGRYELRYGLGGGATIIARAKIDVVVSATLEGPARAAPGATVPIRWQATGSGRDKLHLADRSAPDNRAFTSVDLVGEGGTARLEMPTRPGTYEVRYAYGGGSDIIARHLIEVVAEASLSAPSRAPVGAEIEIAWTGPGLTEDRVHLGDVEGADNRAFASLKLKDGPLKLELPTTPGTYELRYALGGGSDIIARHVIEVVAEASLSAPASAAVTATVDVRWSGPGLPGDRVWLAPAEMPDNRFLEELTPRGRDVLRFEMPRAPGTYELRYAMSDGTVIARKRIDVSAEASLSAPETVGPREKIAVTWTGPALANDAIRIVPVGTPDGTRGDQAKPSEAGANLTLEAPREAGQYELRYALGGGSDILARRPIAVVVKATLSVAPKVGPSAPLSVEWSGPSLANDALRIVPRGAAAGTRGAWKYLNALGRPARLEAPRRRGLYEVRYALASGEVIASAPFEVVVEAAIEAPARVQPGAELAVAWKGPNFATDIVRVVPEGSSDTTKGPGIRLGSTTSPGAIPAPKKPGVYELRYDMGGGGDIVARRRIEVVAEATLQAPGEAGPDELLTVRWTGPQLQSDRLHIAHAGAAHNSKVASVRVHGKGSEVTVRTPKELGQYELRYVFGNEQQIIASQPITVAAEASLAALGQAAPDKELMVAWQGPSLSEDRIRLVPAGAADNARGIAFLKPASLASPAGIAMPETPGRYELRYLYRGKTILARLEVDVRKAQEAPEEERLDAPGIAALLPGASLSGETEAGPWQMVVVPDGTLVVIDPASAPRSSTWRIDEDAARFCDGDTCFDVLRAGDRLILADPATGERRSAPLP